MTYTIERDFFIVRRAGSWFLRGLELVKDPQQARRYSSIGEAIGAVERYSLRFSGNVAVDSWELWRVTGSRPVEGADRRQSDWNYQISGVVE